MKVVSLDSKIKHDEKNRIKYATVLNQVVDVLNRDFPERNSAYSLFCSNRIEFFKDLKDFDIKFCS